MSKEINVLFLDDEENILNSLKRLFISESYGVVVTTNAEEALDIIGREKIKVVISDQRMPHITGVEFLTKVKAKNPDIMRILFTGYTDLQAAEDAINIGEVYRFINKPWNGPDLKTSVQEAINHYNLMIENKDLIEITEKKNKELEGLNMKLSAMFEKQREFTSVVSHELRTPLASIKAAIDIVMSETSGTLSADQNNFLNKAKVNVDRLKRLINDILDLSKLESGRIEMKPQPNDVNKLVQEVIQVNSPAAQKENLFLKSEIDPNVPEAVFDTDRISQVLNNLVNNAIKFTKTGGIVIRAVNHDHKLEVIVEDTGPGIEKSDIPKLFEKFQQLEDAAKCEKGGTGLGLAICKEIIHQHKGKIWVESEITKGSRFCFWVPISGSNGGTTHDTK
ncbi:MAG: ATP-binding protein [Candidatus Omnitrophota bacterium]